jgi:outer membrane protein TolC
MRRKKIVGLRKISIPALSVLLAIPIAAGAQQYPSASGNVLTLEQAITLALRENHLVENAELDVGKAGDTLAATRTHRLPSMHVYTVVTQQLVNQELGADNRSDKIIPSVGPFFSVGAVTRPTAVFAGLILQPLSQQYRIGLDIKQARLARDAESEKLRQVRQSTVDEVKRAYYGILQTQSALDSLKDAIRQYRELERVTSDYVAQQVALKSENLEVRTRLAKAEYEALNLTNSLATEKERLNNLLGRDVRADFSVATVPDVNGFAADLALARSRALYLRPEIQEARLKVEQTEVDRRIKKSEYIPDVSAGFIYMTFRNFDPVVPKNLVILGAAMDWEVFDWGRKRRQLAEKDKTIEQAKNSLREAESLVLIDVGDKFRKLQQTRQALVVAQLSQETARESLRVNVNKYRHTAALLSDVLQSQATLAEANHQYQQALLGYWTARAEFEKAIGQEK